MSQELIQELMQAQEIGCLCFECNQMISNQVLEMAMQYHTQLGIITPQDHLYENMKVSNYLHFFATLSKHKELYEEAIRCMHLEDLQHVKIVKLTVSQKVRCAIAREIIKDEAFIFIQEPLCNLDDDSLSIVLNWLERTPQYRKQIIITSHSLKDICLLPGKCYTINNQMDVVEINTVDNEEDGLTAPLKLSAKVDDKIVLFNPKEIDYIESMNSKSYLNVRGSAFQCQATLDELENKLKQFGFYRCHRSYLVNMQKVVEIVKWTRSSYTLKLEGNAARVPLSKGRLEGMRTLYNL